MYRKENTGFVEKLKQGDEYKELFDYLENIFKQTSIKN